MIEVLRKIWCFAGEEQRNIRKSMVLGFFYAIFHMFQIAAIYVVVLALVDDSTSAAPAWQALALLLVSILGRAIMNRSSCSRLTPGISWWPTSASTWVISSSAFPWVISTTRA